MSRGAGGLVAENGRSVVVSPSTLIELKRIVRAMPAAAAAAAIAAAVSRSDASQAASPGGAWARLARWTTARAPFKRPCQSLWRSSAPATRDSMDDVNVIAVRVTARTVNPCVTRWLTSARPMKPAAPKITTDRGSAAVGMRLLIRGGAARETGEHRRAEHDGQAEANQGPVQRQQRQHD